MRPRGGSGVWEIFMPGLEQGELYKFEIKTRYQGYMATKSDPCAFSAEMRPKTASMVWDLNRYRWSDSHWMQSRGRRQSRMTTAPVSTTLKPASA